MKFKNICLVFLLVCVGNSFAMSDESRYSTPPRMRRGSSNSDVNLDKYAILKTSFRNSVKNLDYASAKGFLDSIEDIYYGASLRFSNPSFKKKIDIFLKSDEVKNFYKDYDFYKINVKEELNKILVQGKESQNGRLLPKELVQIVDTYLCDK